MEKEILVLKEAAEFLSIHPLTLRKLLKKEGLPARKLGKNWRFTKSGLLDWINEGNTKKIRRCKKYVGKTVT